MNVLLVGPWAPASLAVARSLRRRGIATYLLQTATGEYCAPRTFSALAGFGLLPRELSGTPEGIERVRGHARQVNASAILAITDDELVWLARHRDRFEPEHRLLVQAAGSLEPLLSKRHQIAIAREVGLPVLPTFEVRQPEDADAIPRSAYPLAVRPDFAGAVDPTFKIRLARSAGELSAMVHECQRMQAPILAQPFMRLPNLIVHAARSSSGEMLDHRAFLVPRTFEGVTLAIEPWALPEPLRAASDAFVRRAGIYGACHIEFLAPAADVLPYFLEVNVRLGGTTDKVTRLGYDEPALLLQSYGLLPAVPSGAPRPTTRVVNKRVVAKHMLAAARGHLTPFDYPEGSRLSHFARSCVDLARARDSVFDWRDVSGSLRFHLRDVLTRLG